MKICLLIELFARLTLNENEKVTTFPRPLSENQPRNKRRRVR